jgi:ABC-type nitrate/sulfonate/bicarbonate transport system substrate-binding protein
MMNGTTSRQLRKAAGFILAALGVALLAGCPPKPEPQPQPPKPAKPVSLRLAWIPGPTFAGDYVAQEKRYWTEEGLEVQVHPGGFEFNAIKLVAGGSDDFGVTNLPQLLEARANGVPVVAIACIIPRSPIGWVSKKASGITKPQQFVGKKIGAQFGTHTEVTFEALMGKLGIKPESINRVAVKFDPKPFLAGQVDVLPVYITDQPYLLRSNGLELNIIDPFDYGIGLSYGNVYFATEKTIKERPEEVRKFLKGALRGWQVCIDDPEAATKITLWQEKALDPKVTRQQLDATLAMMTKDSKSMTEIAVIDATKVEETRQILAKYGKLPEVDSSKTFTNEYLPASLPAAK